MTKQKLTKMRLMVLGTSIVLISAASVVTYRHQHRITPLKEQQAVDTAMYAKVAKDKAAADKLFRNYLVGMAGTARLDTNETYSEVGTPSSMHITSYVDLSGKQAVYNASVSCSNKPSGGDIDITATVQMQNSTTYVRLDNISGGFDNGDGTSRSLSSLYGPTKGVWLTIPASSSSQVIDVELSHGILAGKTGVMAPGLDTQKVADLLLTNKAFEAAQLKQEGDDYTYSLTIYKDPYMLSLQQLLPDISVSDLHDMVDLVFAGDSTEYQTELTIKADGRPLHEEVSDADLCGSLFQIYAGDGASVGDTLMGKSEIQPAGSIQITPITNAQPFDTLQKTVNR